MINNLQINNISFKAYRKKHELPVESPAEKIIREDKNPPSCLEMYAELDRLKTEIEKADKRLAGIRKSAYSTDETKLMNKIGRMRAHQLLLEQAIKKRFEEELKRIQEKKE